MRLPRTLSRAACQGKRASLAALVVIGLTSANASHAAPVLVWGQSNWGEAVWASDNPDDWDGAANVDDAFPYDGAASIDTDGDGLADDWNTSATNDQIQTASLKVDNDDDNDGYSDTEELALGTSKSDSTDRPGKRGINAAIISIMVERSRRIETQ